MRSSIALPVLLAVTACVSTPPAEDLSAMSAEELRALRNTLQFPACASDFMTCEDDRGQPVCHVYRQEYEFPTGRINRWSDCAPQFIAAQRRILEVNQAIRAADPLPAVCASLPASAIEEAGLDPADPYAAVRFLLKGFFVNSAECTAQLCAWTERNLFKPDQPRPAACKQAQ